MLAIAALLFYAGFFAVTKSFHTDTDAKLAAVLTWSHYGPLLPPLLLWYVSIAVMSTLVIGLLAVALNRGWGAWAVLAATVSAFMLVPFSGLIVLAATARFLGGIAMFCVISILALTFLPANR